MTPKSPWRVTWPHPLCWVTPVLINWAMPTEGERGPTWPLPGPGAPPGMFWKECKARALQSSRGLHTALPAASTEMPGGHEQLVPERCL